ncbi:MAG: T9SS type A sorting domain-containing protein [Bacteroidetes bacterium]|nr:T9SS type A sorting domain-containing protein [Bacteroidota bacterium]
MKKNLLAAAITVFYFTNINCFAQAPPDSCQITVGTCLGQLNAWSREVPFVDLMKTCLRWATLPTANVMDSIPQDADGYPLQIPYTVNGQPQTIQTRMIYGQKPSVLYPSGTYVLLYDGTGTFSFTGDVTAATVTNPGRILLTVVPSTQGIFMTIISSSASDHVRNVRVLMPGTEFTYQSQPFNQKFLNYLAPFKVIRPMWWQLLWQSTEVKWSDRRKTTFYRQSSYFSETNKRGCAYEYIVKLCNMANKDLWLCVPHAADSDYVMNLAQMMRDSLNPNLKIYLEYSNELWNSTNTVAYPWVQANAPQSLNSAQRIAYFYKKNFDIWQMVFGSQFSSRIVRVVGSQLTTPWYGQQEMAYLINNGSGADALAPADYFLTFRQNPTYNHHDYDTLNAWGASTTPLQAINLARKNIPSMHMGTLANNQTATQYGLRYIFYEGGQDLDPQNYSTHPYNPAIYNAQLDTAMYNCYMNEFKFLRDSTTLDLFMHFVLFSDRGEFLNGAPPWGALESVFQDTSVNPSVKYRALMNNIFNCSASTGVSEMTKNNSITVFPNPSCGKFTIAGLQSLKVERLEIYNVLGEKIYSSTHSPVNSIIDLSSQQNGIYFIKVSSEGKTKQSKIVICK